MAARSITVTAAILYTPDLFGEASITSEIFQFQKGLAWQLEKYQL